MELIYQPLELKAGQLNNGYNQIVNSNITRPSWKGNKTYGDTFFIEKRKGVDNISANVPTGTILDSIIIDEVDFILIKNGLNHTIGYYDGNNYSTLSTYNFTVGNDTPIKFAKGYGAKGEITKGIDILDAFVDTHQTGVWNNATEYKTDWICTYLGTTYIALTDIIESVKNINQQPDISDTYWVEYDTVDSGAEASEPDNTDASDLYEAGYLKLKLKDTNIRDTAIIGHHLFFYNNHSNLQGVATEIFYTATEYKDYLGNTVALNADEVYVYVRGTNKVGTRPYVGVEQVGISSDIGEIPVVATETSVFSLHLTTLLGEIDDIEGVELYACVDGDHIIDLVNYNGVLFILTKYRVLFSDELPESNVNIYPLNFFNNLIGLEKLVPFGKMLVVFGTSNTVFAPVIGTEGTEGYTRTELTYNSNLYSKYSVIVSQNSMYVLQDDKQFVEVSILSDNNYDYVVETKNAIESVRGMFDFITGDIYMNQWDKKVYVLELSPAGTSYFRYDLEYKHWDTGNYLSQFYKIEDYLYGEGIYEFNDNYFDNTDYYSDQIVGFDFGSNDLYSLKQVGIVKIILGLNEKVLDYEFEMEYQLGGILHKLVIDLNNYPINIDIGAGNAGLGDNPIGQTLIGNGEVVITKLIGNIVSVTIGLGITASIFDFKIKSKENGFIYGGGVIGYNSKIPPVTEYNYKH